jgi:cytochrome c oxidase subunit 2
MKNVIRSLIVATLCVVAGAGVASAQGAAGTQDTGQAATGNATAPAVPQQNAGAAQGQGPQGAQANPGATGSAATPDTAPTGTVAPPGTGTGSSVGSGTAPVGGQGSAAPQGAGGVAWYDKLANKEIEEEGTFWMPKSVNAAADESDIMFYSVLALSIFFFFAIAICVVYFTIKYRHRPGHKAEPSAAHNDAMEITWTVIPTIIVVFLFWYGWRSYINVVTPPQKAVEIDVLAWRWNWQFTHANGVTDSDLHVPVNTPVRLVMTSKDVLHSFYSPVMRVKQDIVPRRYTYAWFYATKPGTYRLTCAEYCGTSHAQMACLQTDKSTGACLRRAVVVVHDPGDYERYLADKESESMTLPPEELGKKLYEKKGCNACHTVDGTPRVGPSFFHDFGTTVPLSDGSKIQMNEDYIRESLMSPQAKARPGYPPSMPSFEGQLKEVEIQGLIAYIKSLK